MAEALAAEVARVTALLRSARRPDAPALGRWSLAEVAMHLSQAWMIVPGLAGDDRSGAERLLPGVAGRGGGSLIDDLRDLPGLTVSGVDADPERDLAVLADRIEARAGAFLAGLDDGAWDRPHAWLVEGVSATLPTLACHLLNETMVHGYDLARAEGRRWALARPHAALVIDGFLVPVIAGLGPRAMVDQEAARGVRATFQVHVRGGASHLFRFDDGALSIEPPGAARVDCHISADPAAMLLVAWARRSQWPAIATGRLVAWGRRPWLGPRFRMLMRTP